MRTILSILGLSGLSLLAAGGCKWTVFDDLEGETWVTATDRPDNGAANWGVALARVARSGPGGTLAVLGASEAIYNDVVIGPGGDLSVTNEIELNTQFAIGNLSIKPLLLSSPAADEAALVTGLEANRIAVIRAAGDQATLIGVTGLGQPGGATYLTSPPRAGIDDAPTTQILVAQNDVVFGAFFDQARAPNPQTSCALVDDAGAAINIRALGAYRPAGATSDHVLVLTDAGKLMGYDGEVFNGCAGTQGPRAGVVLDVMFMGAQTGSQILTIEDGDPAHVLVQMHDDSGRGRLGVYRIGGASIEEVGAARDAERLRTAAVLQPDGDARRYVLAGMPTALVSGVAAGQVQVIGLDLATGLAATPELTLHDAQPESNQSFGRGVAALPYNGKTIIAVAADNEVFLYFRTSLYGETREGR